MNLSTLWKHPGELMTTSSILTLTAAIPGFTVVSFLSLRQEAGEQLWR